jgi:exosortase A
MAVSQIKSETQRESIVKFAIFLAAILGLFWSTVVQLSHTIWTVETFSHGILIPGIAAWLVWRKRNVIFDAPHDTSWIAVTGVALCAAIWFAGKLVDFRILQNFGLVGLVISGWAVCVGLTVFKKSLFPALFLLFVVPFGTFLDQPLMQGTADVTVRTLRLLNVPVFQDGLQFKLPSGNWSVIEACSGLRYLLASIILGSLFAYLNFRSWAKRSFFIAICILVAIVANWIRAVTVVLVGHFSDMRLGTGDDHVWYGWAFFGLVMYAVFYLANRLTEEESVKERASDSTLIAAVPAGPRSIILWSPVLISLLLAALARFFVAGLLDKAPRNDFFAGISPMQSLTATNVLTYEPDYANGIATLKMSAPNEVEAFVSYYANQANKGKMITGENGLVKVNSDWKIVSFDQPYANSESDAMYEAIVQKGASQRMVLYWFQLPSFNTPNRYVAARKQLIRALTFESDEALFAAVSAPVTRDAGATRNQLRESALVIRKALAEKLESK